VQAVWLEHFETAGEGLQRIAGIIPGQAALHTLLNSQREGRE